MKKILSLILAAALAAAPARAQSDQAYRLNANDILDAAFFGATGQPLVNANRVIAGINYGNVTINGARVALGGGGLTVGNISLGGNFTTAGAVTYTGAYGVSWTLQGATSLTLPTTGTIATLSGSETFTNKTVNGGTISGTVAGSPTLSGNWDFGGVLGNITLGGYGITLGGNVAFTGIGRTLANATDAAAVRTALSLVPGVDYQAFSGTLLSVANGTYTVPWGNLTGTSAVTITGGNVSNVFWGNNTFASGSRISGAATYNGTANYTLVTGPILFPTGTSVSNLSFQLTGNNNGEFMRTTNLRSFVSNGVIIFELNAGSSFDMSAGRMMTFPYTSKLNGGQLAAGDVFYGPGTRSIQIGSYPDGQANATDSLAILKGANVVSAATGSVAIGTYANVSVNTIGESWALGTNATAANYLQFVWGKFAYSNSPAGITIGNQGNATMYVSNGAPLGAINIGNNSVVWSERTTAVGADTFLAHISSFTFGVGSQSLIPHSGSIGLRAINLQPVGITMYFDANGPQRLLLGSPASYFIDGYSNGTISKYAGNNVAYPASGNESIITSTPGGDHRVFLKFVGAGGFGFGYADVSGNTIVNTHILYGGGGGFSAPPTVYIITQNGVGSGGSISAGIINGSVANLTINAGGTYIDTINDLAGHDMVFQPGAGTGTAGGGSLVVVVTPAGGASNNVLNTGNQTAFTITASRAFTLNATTITSNGTWTHTGDINYTGDLTDISDARYKTNVTPLAQEYGLGDLMKLRPVSFDWNAEYTRKFAQHKDTPQIGFIAQDVNRVMPELVNTLPGGDMGVDYTKLTAVLTMGLQRLKTRDDWLFAALFALTAWNMALNLRHAGRTGHLQLSRRKKTIRATTPNDD